MRIVTYGGAISLDGFLTGADGSIDWLHFSKDVQQVMAEYWKSIDTILMGRKTYENAVARQPSFATKRSDSQGKKSSKPAMQTYVFSRTLKTIDDLNVELVSADAADFVRDLKGRPGKDICLMGGGELAQSLFAADLVDEIRINIHPTLLGAGIPTFRDPGHRVKLAFTGCSELDGGCLLANYKVLHAD